MVMSSFELGTKDHGLAKASNNLRVGQSLPTDYQLEANLYLEGPATGQHYQGFVS
jgi:hypothetical protein